jgi:pimeloyl-ACP methyl ester carboxylesterase
MSCFLLLPGAGGDPWSWHLLVPELRRRGHDAVPVAFPAEDDRAGLDRYVEIAVEAAAGHPDLVVVGHSMGALTAPLVCARVPARLLVLLNPMVPRPGETGEQWWTESGHESSGLSVEEAFFHDVPTDVRAEASSRPQPDQSSRPFADPWPLARWPAVRTRVVQGRDDRMFTLDFQRRVTRERLDLDVDEVPGGHLCMLSRPVELADALVGLLEP